MFTPRDYQQQAIDMSNEFLLKCKDPALLDLPTGAGKSIIVAYIAKCIAKLSKKKILCLAPSTELVLQNREKYLELGEPASIFSAGAGGKSIKHDVVFGSPKTVLNSLKMFDDRFALVIIDEAHGITPTLIKIIDSMREKNKNLRVLGLSATCYRMNTGYIYSIDQDGKPMGDQALNPFFKKCIFKLETQYLIDKGYLTPPTTSVTSSHYNTDALEMKGGKFTASSVDSVFSNDHRLTHEIVLDVVEASADRKGVMFFASTIQHAEEIMRSLPTSDSALITGKTPAKEREEKIKQFKDMKFKYLVNVSVLTTGFDAPHVDVIAILRATESASLFQQIVGRGLRLFDNKETCLIMDFAENIERHGLEDNLFKPEIKTYISKNEKSRIKAECDVCGHVNDFGGRKNKENFNIDKQGYFVDLAGDKIIEPDTNKPLPAHFGRRCEHHELVSGSFVRCSGRWSFKECIHEGCSAENDIAARYCSSCKGELVDPNEKLKREFKKIKKSAYDATSDKVISWFCQHHESKAGNIVLKIDWATDCRAFKAYYNTEQKWAWEPLCRAVFGEVASSVDQFIEWHRLGNSNMPNTITSAKQRGSMFYNIKAYNHPEDKEQ